MTGGLQRLLQLVTVVLAAAVVAPDAQTLADSLKGAWTSGGPSFDMLIQDRTILFEFDMKEHPYRLEGETLVIDFQDPALGVQRKRIVRLTPDELEIEDEASGARETLRRMRPDEPDGPPGWLGLYSREMLDWLETMREPRRFSFVLRTAPRDAARPAGTLVVVAHPETGLGAFYEPPAGGEPIRFTPDVFDADWGYGPYFHQTFRSRQGMWFELPPQPFPSSVWIDATDFGEEPHLLTLSAGDIVTGTFGDMFVLAVEANDIVIRPEQRADMWCDASPPPPREAVQPRRLPRPELYNLHGHLMLRPKYLRGC
jgi:hypothetical protein